ncbi:MAG: Redox-active disulfide protein 2 [uncultured bacterium]|nr:MAG: Redox-active disulfide protein 2 [uncultured bacterium]HLD45033.1 nitrophenyl compound nitroreductase subunit ArsF family protein [bacterium]
MKTRNIVLVVLLLLVGLSFAGTYFKQDNSIASSVAAPVSVSEVKMEKGVAAYYFHGTRRCPTCRKIEALTNEAIQTGLATDIKDGRLVWNVLNIDEDANNHFIQDFQLTSSSVILVRYDGGESKKWKNLDKVWRLVRSDKNQFVSYVQSEIKSYLESPAQ